MLPSPDAIFARAQAAWEARAVPPYVSFDVRCERTFLARLCSPNATANFIVRMRDGRTFAAEVAEVTPAGPILGYTLMRGGYITGPAATPFGFYRRISAQDVPYALATPPPPNLAPDPFAPATIAAVKVVDRAYDVSLVGQGWIGAHDCYHLALTPRYAPAEHPLRDLWVDMQSFQIVELGYARRAAGGAADGIVHYRYEPVGPDGIWSVVHIDAELPLTDHAQDAHPFSDLDDITFPTDVPDLDFDASLPDNG